MESAAESFCFFANLAIEVLTFQINNELKVIPEDKFLTQRIRFDPTTSQWNAVEINSGGLFFEGLSIFRLKNALSQVDHKHKSIISVIDKYFQQPRKTQTGWDLTNTSLWQLRQLRNHVAHFQLFNRFAIAGGPTYFLFRFTVSAPSKNHEGIGLEMLLPMIALEK